MPYGGAGFKGQPSNNIWVGDSYSTMSRNSYPSMNQSSTMNPYMQNQPQQLPSINNIIRVMGPESAQSYMVGPDSQVILMDYGNPIFYIKRSDGSGYSEIRAYRFEEIPLAMATSLAQPPQQVDSANTEYVTKSDFEDFKKMIEDLVMKNE